MRNKNNWSRKTDFKKKRILEKLMSQTKLNKPSVNEKGNVLWGTTKNSK